MKQSMKKQAFLLMTVFLLLMASVVTTKAQEISGDKIDNVINWMKGKEGSNDYNYYALKFVREAFESIGIYLSKGYEYVSQAADDMITSTDDNPPKGAVVFFDWNGTIDGEYKNWGQIGVSLGDGSVILATSKGVSIKTIEQVGLTYRGWGVWGAGNTITSNDKTVDYQAQTETYISQTEEITEQEKESTNLKPMGKPIEQPTEPITEVTEIITDSKVTEPIQKPNPPEVTMGNDYVGYEVASHNYDGLIRDISYTYDKLSSKKHIANRHITYYPCVTCEYEKQFGISTVCKNKKYNATVSYEEYHEYDEKHICKQCGYLNVDDAILDIVAKFPEESNAKTSNIQMNEYIRYPYSAFWSHKTGGEMNTSNPFEYTTSGCVCHSPSSNPCLFIKNSCTCNYYEYNGTISLQCVAFVRLITDTIFGSPFFEGSNDWSSYTDFEQLMPGDVVIYTTPSGNQHFVVVTSKYDNYIEVLDANGDGHCGIGVNKKIQRSIIDKNGTRYFHYNK